MTCALCRKRKVARGGGGGGENLCQRCRHRLYPVQGPKHEPACTACRDTGRSELGGCDIPGCVHWTPCNCETGHALRLSLQRKTEIYEKEAP